MDVGPRFTIARIDSSFTASRKTGRKTHSKGLRVEVRQPFHRWFHSFLVELSFFQEESDQRFSIPTLIPTPLFDPITPSKHGGHGSNCILSSTNRRRPGSHRNATVALAKSPLHYFLQNERSNVQPKSAVNRVDTTKQHNNTCKCCRRFP